jgi:cell shape-determining protein MreC
MKKIFLRSFILLLVILALWQWSALANSFHSGLTFFATPFWKIEKEIGNKIESYSTIFLSKKKLHEDNKNLRVLLKEEQLRGRSFSLLLLENQELRALLGERKDERDFLLASVLVKPNRTPFDVLIVNSGGNEGVLEGNTVYAYSTIAIGKVTSVSPYVSHVTLFSSPGVITDVVIGKSRVVSQAHGVGGGNLTITLPRGVQIEIGDAVVLPSSSASLVGVVEKIEETPSDAFKKILFKVPVNISELHFVEITK